MTNSQVPHRTDPLQKHLRRLAATLLVGSFLQVPVAQAQTAGDPVLSQPVQTFKFFNQAAYTYDGTNDPRDSVSALRFQGATPMLGQDMKRLIDPMGRIVGCAGEALTDYSGFNVALYEADPSDPTGASIGALVPLTQTEFPDRPDNNIPRGIKPNAENSNPFFLANGDQGVYNFLLDPKKGQLEPGRSYILIVNAPRNSIYGQRRIKLTLGAQNGSQVTYAASSLDGKPISASDGRTTVSGVLQIGDAEQTSLVLAALDLEASVCQAQEIQIIKTGDRAAAEPGDTVIYRLSVRNLSSAPVSNLVITDSLPLGFSFRSGSARAEFKGTAVPVTATQTGSTLTFGLPETALPSASVDQNEVLNIAYAALLTPDAVRGNGRNSAIVQGVRSDNRRTVKDGPANHQLRIRAGIVSDCGTILGRVFVDKNFDGEQQPGESGVPNAVVFMDDGNRITADANGLFSVANVLPGYRTGVLDLSSTPGYTLAPNLYFKERNSQSRLVHLEPGGLVRMNFAVTPTSQGR